MTTEWNNSLSRPWFAFDAYLFDIDGTLLTSDDAVHYFAFCEALTTIAERPMNLDGVVAHGNTDVGILRDALALARVPDASWRPRRNEICQSMGQFVHARRADLRVRALPGVVSLLHELRGRGALLGVATGNLQRIGECKLDAAGLHGFFEAGSFSDAFESRADVFQAALASVRRLRGDAVSVCFIGDTPQDIEAAQRNHTEVIAVATGIYSYEDLLAHSPSACCHTLSELLIEA